MPRPCCQDIVPGDQIITRPGHTRARIGQSRTTGSRRAAGTGGRRPLKELRCGGGSGGKSSPQPGSGRNPAVAAVLPPGSRQRCRVLPGNSVAASTAPVLAGGRAHRAVRSERGRVPAAGLLSDGGRGPARGRPECAAGVIRAVPGLAGLRDGGCTAADLARDGRLWHAGRLVRPRAAGAGEPRQRGSAIPPSRCRRGARGSGRLWWRTRRSSPSWRAGRC